MNYEDFVFQTLKGSLQTMKRIEEEELIRMRFKPSKDRYKLSGRHLTHPLGNSFKPSKDRYKLR